MTWPADLLGPQPEGRRVWAEVPARLRHQEFSLLCIQAVPDQLWHPLRHACKRARVGKVVQLSLLGWRKPTPGEEAMHLIRTSVWRAFL